MAGQMPRLTLTEHEGDPGTVTIEVIDGDGVYWTFDGEITYSADFRQLEVTGKTAIARIRPEHNTD